MTAALTVQHVGFAYGERQALVDVDCVVPQGTVHAFLGPNGSGKSTLFKLMATLLPMQSGTIELLHMDVSQHAAELRRRMGVVFQSPALDRKLSVRQNLRYGGQLFGLGGADLEGRIDRSLERAGLSDRGKDSVESLSGGLQRRVELAKVTLHDPELLLLDEPSTGLDPAARQELWRMLRGIPGLTVLFTTHLMDEAADADQVTILHEGRVVGSGTPDALIGEIGEEMVEIDCADPPGVTEQLARGGFVPATVQVVEVERGLRLQGPGAHRLAPELMARLGDTVQKLTMGRPDLEDVFIRKTGHRFAVAPVASTKAKRRRR